VFDNGNQFSSLVLKEQEYCSEGDFEKYLIKKGNRLSEEEAIPFIKQLAAGIGECRSSLILLGLGHLRNKGVIHRFAVSYFALNISEI
jgi:serine/threonine protein kinase